jgi:hypothetical protein
VMGIVSAYISGIIRQIASSSLRPSRVDRKLLGILKESFFQEVTAGASGPVLLPDNMIVE